MRAEYERVFTYRGGVAHLIDMDDTPTPLCGRIHQPRSWWYGTGDQREFDIAEKMPLCKRCERAYVTLAALNYGKGGSNGRA